MSFRYGFYTLLFTLNLLGLNAQETNYQMAFKELEEQRAQLLLLGTFHFKDAGLDGYKPRYDVDIFSEKKQEELKVVLDELKNFAPTKIAVEFKKQNQPKLDSLYEAYLSGNFDLRANEIYQVAFRLGKMMGHKKLYAVDATARSFEKEGNETYYKEKAGYYMQQATPEQLAYESALDSAYFTLYEMDDRMKTRVPLKDTFMYINSPGRLSAGHGHYLIGTFKMGEGTDYFGPDSSIWWYTRNMRIFHNLLRIKEPGDRIMLLIGAGHVPIIQFQADASFDFELVPVSEVLD